MSSDDSIGNSALDASRYVPLGGDAWYDPEDDMVYIPFDRVVINFTHEEFSQTCQFFNSLLVNLNSVREYTPDDIDDMSVVSQQSPPEDDKDYN